MQWTENFDAPWLLLLDLVLQFGILDFDLGSKFILHIYRVYFVPCCLIYHYITVMKYSVKYLYNRNQWSTKSKWNKSTNLNQVFWTELKLNKINKPWIIPALVFSAFLKYLSSSFTNIHSVLHVFRCFLMVEKKFRIYMYCISLPAIGHKIQYKV